MRHLNRASSKQDLVSNRYQSSISVGRLGPPPILKSFSVAPPQPKIHKSPQCLCILCLFHCPSVYTSLSLCVSLSLCLSLYVCFYMTLCLLHVCLCRHLSICVNTYRVPLCISIGLHDPSVSVCR